MMTTLRVIESFVQLFTIPPIPAAGLANQDIRFDAGGQIVNVFGAQFASPHASHSLIRSHEYGLRGEAKSVSFEKCRINLVNER
jgi:hypothetical protein